MRPTEIFGFITGLVCVLLGIREIPWTWPVGIVNNLIFFVLFWRHGLYANACLQFLYIAVSIYGWWNWLRGGEHHKALRISRTPTSLAVVLLFIAVAGTFSLHKVLAHFTDSSVPWMDAFGTTFSVIAQYLMSRKMMGTWAVYIAVDVVFITMYINKGLYLTASLFTIFIVLCIGGYIHWNKSLTAVPQPFK